LVHWYYGRDYDCLNMHPVQQDSRFGLKLKFKTLKLPFQPSSLFKCIVEYNTIYWIAATNVHAVIDW